MGAVTACVLINSGTGGGPRRPGRLLLTGRSAAAHVMNQPLPQSAREPDLTADDLLTGVRQLIGS